ncbi:MAG: ABC transporter permease [Clostridium sp.]|nr:ABC transporter permease [Clostridium sp.]
MRGRRQIRKERRCNPVNSTTRYPGRLAQIWVYFGKLMRMFVYQSDWKMLPMAAVIAGIVTFAVGQNLFKTQEGTSTGCFALVCVCIWNGFFNSIQVICRERPIIKREHREGLHISSYICSHLIYQMLLCAAQTVILISVCRLAGIEFPQESLITGNFLLDLGLTLFLITYAADMMSLTVSCLVRNTTTAMTLMPFLLIFQLIFSGGLIPLEGAASKITNLTISKWGLNSLCTLGNFNKQPMVTLWNTLFKFRGVEFEGTYPVKYIMTKIEKEGKIPEFIQASGQYTQKAEYLFSADNLTHFWIYLVIYAAIFAIAAIICLEFIDHDKR